MKILNLTPVPINADHGGAEFTVAMFSTFDQIRTIYDRAVDKNYGNREAVINEVLDIYYEVIKRHSDIDAVLLWSPAYLIHSLTEGGKRRNIKIFFLDIEPQRFGMRRDDRRALAQVVISRPFIFYNQEDLNNVN